MGSSHSTAILRSLIHEIIALELFNQFIEINHLIRYIYALNTNQKERNMGEYIGLMLTDLLEKSAAIKDLIKNFESKLPSHFGKARFIAAPLNTNLEHVIRADCKECKTRAVVHVVRKDHVLSIKEINQSGEIKISYDRTMGCCDECKKLNGAS